MTLTADQTARISAAQIDYEYRVFAGPPRGNVAEQDVTEGQTYTATATTTLASAWDGISTSISLTDASGFTTTGAVYIPATGNFLGKWVAYTGKSVNTLTGCSVLARYSSAEPVDLFYTREPGAPIGATVNQWQEITETVTAIDYSEFADDEIGTWSATIRGHNFDSRVIRPNNGIMVQARFWPAPGESENPAFRVLFHGYIQEGSTGDDWRQGKLYTVTVRPIDMYLENAAAPGRRYGLSNLANGATTTTSSVLSNASLIDHDYEVIGNPSLAGAQAVDGSMDTIWASSNIPSKFDGNDPVSGYDRPFISEVGWGPVGSGDDGAYFVVWFAGDQDLIHYFLATAPNRNQGTTLGQNITAGSPSGSSATLTLTGSWGHLIDSNGFLRIATTGEEIRYNERDGDTLTGIERGANGTTAAAASSGAAIYNEEILYRFGDGGALEHNNRMVFCQNRETFESWASVSDEVEVKEWRTMWSGTFGPLLQAGDILRIRGPLDTGVQTKHEVKWGSEATTGWPAGTIGYGQNMICTDLSDPATPGNYSITDEPSPAQNLTKQNHAWIQVEIPQFNITLDGAIDSSQTTIDVTPTTAGLTQSGGRIQLDSEQIDYTGVTESGATVQLTGCTRGVAGTTAAAHTDGTQVFQVENAVAHRNEEVTRFGWKRKEIYDNGILVCPRFFEIWYSTLASPTDPHATDATDTTFTADWTRIFDVDNHYGVEWFTPPGWTGDRLRHMMLIVQEQSDAGYAIVNEIECYRTGQTDPSPEALSTAGDLVEYILTNDFGLDPAQIEVGDIGPIRDDLVNTDVRYLELLRQICKLVGAVLYITRDNKIKFYASPWHPLGTSPLGQAPEIIHEFDRSSARRLNTTILRRNRVNQVKLEAINPTDGRTYEVQYPRTARPYGDTIEVNRSFYGAWTEARNLAEYIYLQKNVSTEITLVPVGHADGLRLYDRITVTWDTDTAGDFFSGRNFIITGITMSLSAPFGAQKRSDWAITAREYTT